MAFGEKAKKAVVADAPEAYRAREDRAAEEARRASIAKAQAENDKRGQAHVRSSN